MITVKQMFILTLLLKCKYNYSVELELGYLNNLEAFKTSSKCMCC